MNANNTSPLAPVLPPATLTTEQWQIATQQANTLHTQISDLTAELTKLEQKRWIIAVILGGLLTRMKAASGHGEWQKLFPKRNHDSQFNQNYDTCPKCEPWFAFGLRTSEKYIKLYHEVLRRAQTLGTINITPLTNGTLNLDDHTTAELTKLSDATTLRQAYLDFGIISPPPPKHLGFTTSGNPLGMPPKSITALTPEELKRARQQATRDAAKLIRIIHTYIKQHYAALLRPQERDLLAQTLIDYGRQLTRG